MLEIDKTMWEYWKNKIIENKHIIFLIIFSGILLFYRSSMRTFWMDETAVLQYVKFSPTGFIFEYFRHPDNHPPLYYFLVLICTKILSWNELAIRLVSILSGIGVVVVNYFFAERVLQNKKYAFIVGFFTAFSSFFVLYSQMARYHSLVALSTLGALYFAYRLFVEGYTQRIFVYYIVSAILVGYIDYPHFIYLLILTNIFYAYRVFRCRQWLVSLKKWIFSHIVIGAACVPMIWFVYSRIVHQGDHALGITKNLLSNSLENFIAGILIHPYVFFFGENILPWNYVIFTLGIVVLIGSLIGLIKKFLRKEIWYGQKIVFILGLLLILLNTVFFNIVNPRYNFIVYPKYVMVAFPIWIMLIVIGLSGVYSKKIRIGLYVMWFTVSVAGLINFYQAKNYFNASYFSTFSSFEFVEDNSKQGEYLAITGDANVGVYDFYRTTYFKNLLPLPQDSQGVLPEVPSGTNVWFFVTASDDALESTATDSKIPPGYSIINRFDSVPLDPTLQKIKEKILHRPSYVYKYSVLLLQKN